ncbi:hypothetical protein [Rhizobium sp. SSA_523]|uniref:hypothetical protein n=1 Tax=Rhizobium sp. SSA_523 TaxID=2952477 RepID=UPI0020914897|nr:hypothetical protein [Rhizobium sp. SSA_523]MCO5732140.1 hypothetical protein [Rhizobium sp. SSA_523]WKC25618.1 hypothetical protein QTJ18_16815 [Rhizobium sp. SSA_523]
MHGSRLSEQALAWAAFLASYILVFLMIFVPLIRHEAPATPPSALAAGGDGTPQQLAQALHPVKTKER